MKAVSIWRRAGNIVHPVGEESLEALHSYRDGQNFVAETRGARNIDQLRMFWALCQIAADNSPNFSTKEVAKKNLLRALGYVDIWFDVHGQMQTETQSIATQSMPQHVFAPFFQRAIDMIAAWLSLAPEEVRRRVNEITSVKGYERR